MINVRRNVKRKYQQAFDQSREVITEINLFWCSEGYIVWLLGCAVSTQWTHPVCLLCISTCCGSRPRPLWAGHQSSHSELCSPKISSNGCARINLNLGNTQLNLQILQTSRGHNMDMVKYGIMMRREGWEIVVFLQTDRVMHQVVCVGVGQKITICDVHWGWKT